MRAIEKKTKINRAHRSDKNSCSDYKRHIPLLLLFLLPIPSMRLPPPPLPLRSIPSHSKRAPFFVLSPRATWLNFVRLALQHHHPLAHLLPPLPLPLHPLLLLLSLLSRLRFHHSTLHAPAPLSPPCVSPRASLCSLHSDPVCSVSTTPCWIHSKETRCRKHQSRYRRQQHC